MHVALSSKKGLGLTDRLSADSDLGMQCTGHPSTNSLNKVFDRPGLRLPQCLEGGDLEGLIG